MSKIVASNTLELPYYKSIGRQRGRGFGARNLLGEPPSFSWENISSQLQNAWVLICENTYKTTKKKKEHKEDTIFTETGDDDVEFIEGEEGVPHITHVNNILHSIFSNAELYINNHQIHNSNGLYGHKSHISNNFKSKLSDYKGVLHC